MEIGLNKYEPLYLKHRPQALDELVGQVAVLRTLSNAIQNNRLSHAYLFTGPRGTGKTSTARILAKSLNCEAGPTVNPCQKCSACNEIAAGISPAVFEIDAASNNSVDDARALIERAPLVAVGGRFKLYIIDECHMLTKEAFNALLKTIEEPPPQVVFILATTEEHKVPPTIISRCQRLMFKLVNLNDLTTYLKEVASEERINIDEDAIRIIARRSAGGLRDALGLLDQAGLLSSPTKAVSVKDLLSLIGLVHEDVLVNLSKNILDANGQVVLADIDKLLSEGREPAVLAQELAKHFLNLVKASYLLEGQKINYEELGKLVIGSPEYLDAISKQAPTFDRAELVLMVEQLDRLEQSCRRTTQPAMTLEMGLLALCHRQDLFLVRNLSERVASLESKIENGVVADTKVVTTSQKIEKPVSPEKISPDTTISMVLSSDVTSEPEEAPALVPEVVSEIDFQPPPAPKPKEDAVDIDSFWSQLIDQLEERHRPTWSLVSTHAFPLHLGEADLTIGVLRDNFQKMIENKSEHIKGAAAALLKRAVTVRVKVVEQAPQGNPSTEVKKNGNNDKTNNQEKAVTLSMVSVTKPQDLQDPQVSTGITKEAYKLFEGPGSRQIY